MKKMLNGLKTSKVAALLLVLLVGVIMGACSPANSIKGHSYATGTSSSGMKIYFSPSGAAQITYYVDGETKTFSHLTYTINGNNVEIYFDYSDNWKLEAQGTLVSHYIYDPKEDVLIMDDGTMLHRLQ